MQFLKCLLRLIENYLNYVKGTLGVRTCHLHKPNSKFNRIGLLTSNVEIHQMIKLCPSLGLIFLSIMFCNHRRQIVSRHISGVTMKINI